MRSGAGFRPNCRMWLRVEQACSACITGRAREAREKVSAGYVTRLLRRQAQGTLAGDVNLTQTGYGTKTGGPAYTIGAVGWPRCMATRR